MKTIAASVGLVALGVSTLHSEAQSSNMQEGKPWSVAVSLRGFYDDNVNGTKKDKVDSFGIEVSPTLGFGMAWDQTDVDLSYTYSGKWYENRPGASTDHWDHTHILTAGADHRFSPRHSLSVKDSFVIGQEPDVLRILNMPTATYQRVAGDNVRNYGSIIFNTEVTELLGFEAGYENAFWDYNDEQSAADIDGAGDVIRASNSGMLDRLDHRIHLDSRWHFRPETVGILGYQFTQTGFTGDEVIAGSTVGGAAVESDDRDTRTHAVYAGVEHSFNPTLSGKLKAGAQYADYYGNPDDGDDLFPYVQANLSYAYAEESSAQIGLQHQLSAADLVGSTGDFVQNMSATSVYGSLVHRIMPKFYGTLLANYQYSTYNGGGAGIDDESENFLQLGIDFMYRFTPHFSAHAGYNFDTLDSDSNVHEDFDRNRVYLGVTAQY